MSEGKNKDLVSSSELERKITSPEVIDYLAGKLKEHDLKGIKVGVEQGDSRIDLALWREAENNRWKTLKSQDIPTLHPKQPANSGNQEKFSQTEEKKEVLKTVDANSINNNDGNSGSEGSK